jgi:hypothetical protein
MRLQEKQLFFTEHYFDDVKWSRAYENQPLAVCDKTAQALTDLNRKDIFISESTLSP